MQIKKYETKDRYGNSKSFEFFEGSADMDIPGMTDMPDHPGEPKGTDTVPAWLTPGEFVINKEATDMYGPLLKNINDEGRKMQNGEPHNHPSEAMYAADGNVVGTPFKRPASLKNMKTSTDWIDDNLLDNLKLIESGGRHFKDDGTLVTSPAGALGAYQWMPESAKDPGYGIEAFDPTTISEAGMRAKSKEYLEQIQRHNPTWSKDQVLRAYNFGPKASSDGRTIPKETFEYPYKVLQGTQSPDYSEFTIKEIDPTGAMAPNEFGDIDTAGAMAADETIPPVITQETLSTDVQTLDRQIKDTRAELASIKKEEVATEDPSFLARAGNFISDAVSSYRDMREDYRKRYVDYYNADQGYFDSIYRQAGGPVPQYYAVGDEVRDYYRSGIPMPGSAPTYNYSSAPTFETMADTIKDKLEKEEAERLREAQQERFGAADDLSMDRLKTMQLTEKLDKLERQKAALNSERFKEADQASVTDLAEMKLREQLDASSKGTREDAFNKNYYTGVPGDVPSADEFMNIPKDTMPTKIDVAPINPTFYDAFGNPYDDAEQARASDLINEADSKAGMQRQMQINSLGQRVPITDKPFYDMTASEAASLDDANLSLYQDLDVPAVNESEVPSVFYRDDRHGTPSGNYEELKILNQRAREAQALRLKGEDMGTSINTINNFSDQELRKLNAEIVAQKEKVRKAKIREDYAGQLKKEQQRLESMITNTATLEKDAIENKIALLQIDKKEALINGNETKANEIQEQIDKTIIDSGTTKVNDKFISDTARKAALNNLEVINDGTTNGFEVNTVEKKGKQVANGSDGNGNGNGNGDGDEKFVKTKAFLSKYFGDLFDTKELGRMAVLYLGSRAMGASHNGSLAYSGKSYIKRMEIKDAAHLKNVNEYIKGGKHTAKSIGKFKVSRDANDLIRIGANGIASIEQLDKISVADKTGVIGGKKAYKLKLTMSDGSEQIILSFDKKNPKEIPDNWTKDLSYDKNSPEGQALLKDNREQNIAFVKDYIKDFSDSAKGTVSSKYSNSKGGLNYMAIGTQAGNWATTHGFRSDLMPSVMEIALADMASDIGNEKKKLNPTEMRIAPYLNAALIRSSVAQDVGNVFSYDVDGEEQNMSTKEITSMNNRIMSWRGSGASLRTPESRSKLSSSYKELYDMFQADKNGTTVIYSQRFGADGKALAWKNPIVGDKEQYEQAVQNKKSNESLFHAWLRATL